MRPSLESRPALRVLLAACFFVCPLLFFTNLTRNPYVTQISLLNAALLAGGALLLLEGGLPRTPLNAPLSGWVGACAVSWAAAYVLHAPFFRPSMAAEGGRAFLFLLGNCLCPFFLAAAFCGDAREADVEPGPWAVFAAVWGGLWLMFPSLRAAVAPGVTALGPLLWDGYGGLLWIGGFAAALWLCRRGRWGDFLHLGLTAAFLASAYGVMQYFNREIIWSTALNPYGGRAVSTFGNPNFMSSYNVILLPVATAYFSRAKGAPRWIYAALALVLEAALLCSLTRSSWIGATAALTALLLAPEFRARAAQDPRPHGLLACAGLSMALLWPSSLIAAGYAPSVLGRVTEVVEAARTRSHYGSFHQRVLIWTSGWLMGAENPLTGKGYGLFELYYPFFQGHLLSIYDAYRNLRTHANNAHNEIVEVWAQTGLLGLGVYGWLWTSFAASCRRWWSRGQVSLVHAAFAAGALGMLVDNMLNVSLHFAVPAFLFWWAVGTAVAPGCEKPAPPPPGTRRWALRAAAVLIAALGWIWLRVWFRETHYFAGFKLLRHRNYAAAIKELERSRSWGPREVNSIYELGNAYAQSERFPEAVEAYRAALRANAGYDEIYYNIGSLLSSRLGKREEAIADFRVAHFVNPLSGDVYSSLSNAYLSDPGRYADAALPLLLQAVRFHPDSPAHWNNLGYLYTLKKDWARAEQAYARALTIDPSLAVAEQNLAAAAAQAGRPRPKVLGSLAELRRLEGLLARRDYSESTLSLARRLDAELPDNPKIRFLVGGLLMARGRPAEAVSALEWVVARQPAHLSARLNLGEAYRALGDAGRAAAQYRAAAALEPSNELARRRLSELSRP